MTVTEEQWEMVAADLGMPLADLQKQIAEIDDRVELDRRERAHQILAVETMFDRDLDPLTLGQWAFLYESRWYKYIRQTVLPNRLWIATIWQGINENPGNPPVVMETSVFRIVEGKDRVGSALFQEDHRSLQEATEAHDRIVRSVSTGDALEGPACP